jgi:hypothetical protein
MTHDEALAFLAVYAKNRYPDADAALLCGSTAAGAATATSDLDLVVLFPALPQGAYRETIDAHGTLVESFCHDLGTLRHFIDVNGRPTGIPILAAMVAEGIPVPGFPGTLIGAAKRIASAAIADGPPSWDATTIDHQRYTLSSLCDELDPPQSSIERVALAAALYAGTATFALRAAGRFSGNGKGLARALERYDPALAADLAAAIEALVASGDSRAINAVVDRVLAPYGGRLIAGYAARAPADWRVDE